MLGIVQGAKAALALGAGLAGVSAIAPIYASAMARVEVVKDVNEGSQIQDALVMAQSEGLPDGMSLRMLKAGGYLARIPKGWDASSSTPTKVLSSAYLCKTIDESYSSVAKEGCPPCGGSDTDAPACMDGGSPVLRPF